METTRFAGRRVLITGATAGIGLAGARRIAAEGGALVLRVETDSGVEIGLPQLHIASGEAAGVRLHARGVRVASEIGELTGPDDVPVEFHLLQLWRA